MESAAVATTTFADRLAEASSSGTASSSSGSIRGSTCSRSRCAATRTLGRPAAAEATARFCCGIIDAVAPYAVAVKPQLAFFEVLGSDGIAAFERVVRATPARPGCS